MATPPPYSCLENPTDRGDWWATVHVVAKSQAQLSAHTPCLVDSADAPCRGEKRSLPPAGTVQEGKQSHRHSPLKRPRANPPQPPRPAKVASAGSAWKDEASELSAQPGSSPCSVLLPTSPGSQAPRRRTHIFGNIFPQHAFLLCPESASAQPVPGRHHLCNPFRSQSP